MSDLSRLAIIIEYWGIVNDKDSLLLKNEYCDWWVNFLFLCYWTLKISLYYKIDLRWPKSSSYDDLACEWLSAWVPVWLFNSCKIEKCYRWVSTIMSDRLNIHQMKSTEFNHKSYSIWSNKCNSKLVLIALNIYLNRRV